MKRPILTLPNPRPRPPAPPAPPDPLGDTPVPLIVTVEAAKRLGIIKTSNGDTK